jgi:predicted esterase
MNRSLAPLAAVVGLALAGPALAEPVLVQRYELGLRLRAFEVAWDEQPDPAARKRTLEPLKRALDHFFGLNVFEAGHDFDDARFALRPPGPPSAAERWAASLYLKPDARLIDAEQAVLPCEVRRLYEVPGGPGGPAGALARVTLLGAEGRPVGPAHESAVTGLPLAVRVPLAGAGEEDYRLRFEVVVAGKVLVSREQTLSRAERLAERLARLEKPAGPPPPGTVEALTVRATADLLRELANGETMETDYPAAHLLHEAEEVVRAAAAGKSYYGGRRAGQFRLRLPLADDRSQSVRLLAPEAVKSGKPLPLVIALHGAGGSENLFFDAYGHGEAVRLCEKRGWLLVAPRSAGFFRPPTPGELIDAVGKLYPVDPKRVFVVGHSMGAAQAVTMAGQAPERLAGVAPLGGGGQVRPSPALKSLPFFVGCGGEDFILNGARRLARDLTKAGVERVEYREYPEVEHLMVVPVALPEVFAWLDQIAGGEKGR